MNLEFKELETLGLKCFEEMKDIINNRDYNNFDKFIDLAIALSSKDNNIPYLIYKKIFLIEEVFDLVIRHHAGVKKLKELSSVNNILISTDIMFC